MNTKHMRIWIACLSILTLIGFVAACGGVGGSADGGIGGTGISIGAISGFGSIYVNGVEFETSTATITGDDDVLKLGQVVRVEGEFDDNGVNGTASSVEINSIVEGPISESVDTTQKIITVVEQVVFYNGSTVFEDSVGNPLTPDQLNVDNVVEVYGFPGSSFQIIATRVEKKSNSFNPGVDVIEVKGKVSSLNTTQMIFNINNLEVHYSMATTFDNGSMSDLTDGRFVEVKGDNDPTVNGLDADKIEFEGPFSGNDGDLLEVEGNISWVSTTASTDFVVNGTFRVDASGALFEGGTAADIAVDVEVEVEGQVEDRMGELILVAHEVEFETEDDVRIEAFVEAVNTATMTLTTLGITINYDGSTEFEDKSGGVDPFTDTDIDATPPTSDWLLIEATIDGSDNLIATKVERDNDDADPSRVTLKGPAENIVGTSFDILGVDIAHNTSLTEYYLGEDTEVGQTVFFDNLTESRLVKARGSYNSGTGTLTAERLELDD